MLTFASSSIDRSSLRAAAAADTITPSIATRLSHDRTDTRAWQRGSGQRLATEIAAAGTPKDSLPRRLVAGTLGFLSGFGRRPVATA